MKVLTVASQKGGAGKTTLSINLAIAAIMNRKRTCIIDLDPQASASDWADTREGGNEIELEVISAVPNRLAKVLEVAKQEGFKLAIIDTAPHSETATLAAMRVSDFVLIPCRPGVLDIKAIKASVELARLAKKEHEIVINCAPPVGKATEEAKAAIQIMGANVSQFPISQRAAFSHSLTQGCGVIEYDQNSKATIEIQKLYKHIKKELSL